MRPTHPILQKCLQKIESLPNIKANISSVPYVSNTVLADGQLILNTPQATVEYICEIKSHITRETINDVIEYFIHFRERLDKNHKPLLITESLSNQIVEDLLKKDIEFIDVAGNIYLNSPSFYLLVRRPSSRLKDSLKDSVKITNTTLRVIFALLRKPTILLKFNNPEYSLDKKLPNLTRFEADKLCKLNYLEKRHGGYQIIDYLKLLERWELAYAETLRSQLFIDTFTHIQDIPFSEISELLIQQANDLGYLIGGELGAAFTTNYLHPTKATLHVPENYAQIFVNLRLKPSPKGEITFLKKWTSYDAWDNNENPQKNDFADPLLMHAELMMSKDERLRETADILFNKFIKPKIHA